MVSSATSRTIPPVPALLGAAALLAAAASPARAEGPYETPPVRDARSLLPDRELEAPEYRIEPVVPCRDLLYRFEIVTPSGSFGARGLAELPIRLREAHALAVLAERSAGEVAAESAGDTVEGAVGSVVKVIEEPGETARGAARGVGRWAKRTVLSARELATDVKEKVDEARSEDDGAESPADETSSGTPEASSGGPAEEPPNAAGETARAVGRFVLGHSGARRRYAAELGVDPYTRNTVLAAELDRVAWSASAARFGTGLMIPDVPLAAEVQDVYDLVWAKHPRDLEVRNRGLADGWGVDRKARDRFFWNDAWTPTEQTALVSAIESLGGTPGKRTLIEDAAALEEPEAIGRRVADVRLLEELHAAGTRFSRVEAAEGALWATTGDEVLVPLAVDHVAWTAELETSLRERAGAIARFTGDSRRRVLVVTGTLSDRARSALAGEGWLVRPLEDER